MTPPRKRFLYFLVDVNNASFYVDKGVVKKSSVWKPLKHHPDNWRDLQLSFGTNEKYFSPNLAYSVPQTFINDGATIIRSLLYDGKGYEEEVYIVILKWNKKIGERWLYELEYKGKLDLSEAKDLIEEGVTVNTVEGGLWTLLQANDSTTYEIVCDETNPDIVRVKFDGITLRDRYNYSLYDVTTAAFSFAIPLAFINNDGDSVGVIHGDSQFEVISDDMAATYTTSSPNYIFQSILGVTVHIAGQIKFTIGSNTGVDIYFITSKNQTFHVFNAVAASTQIINIDQTIDLVAGEKLYLLGSSFGEPNINWKESKLSISFDTRNSTSDEDEVVSGAYNFHYDSEVDEPWQLGPVGSDLESDWYAAWILASHPTETDLVDGAEYNDYTFPLGFDLREPQAVVPNSTEYFLKATREITANITGSVNINLSLTRGGGVSTIHLQVGLYTSLYKNYIVYDQIVSSGDINVSINSPITLEAGEKVFIYLTMPGYQSEGGTGTLTQLGASFSASFTATIFGGVFCLQPLQLLKQLVSKMTDGKYTADSHHFTVHNNILTTCGDAIRKTDRSIVPNYHMATSFQDFFTSYSAIYDLGIKIVDNVLWVEPKKDLYKDDVEIFDLGEVDELEVDVATDKIISNIKCGYPDQDYDERSGKYEFNSTQEYKLPIRSVNKDLDITSKYRGDGFGIEFIRLNLNSKDTTDNSGDKQVFFVNADTSAVNTIASFEALKSLPEQIATPRSLKFDSTTGQFFFVNSSKNEFTYITSEQKLFTIAITIYGNLQGSSSDNVRFDVILNGTVIRTRTLQAPQGMFRVGFDLTQTFNYNDKIKVLITPTFNALISVNQAGMTLQTESVGNPIFTLNRANYSSITGVIDNTVFNVEEMTPKRQLLAHGSYLRSLLYQLPADKIIFQSAAKNKNLSTTLNGATIYEGGDVTVGDLGSPIFLPYYGSFKFIPPFTFAQTMKAIGTGYIKGTYNGYDVYFLPVGDMTVKPATGEQGTAKLLLAPKTDLKVLLKLASNGLFIKDYQNNMLFISNHSPIHFVRYNKVVPTGYHNKDMFDDWVHQRFERYISQPAYLQKWQTSDPVRLQFITASMGLLNIKVYNSKAQFVEQVDAVLQSNISVQLPYTLQYIEIDLSDYEEDDYVFVLCADTTRLAISEWQNIKEDHPETYLFEYYNSFNKLDAYFDTWRPSFRIEGLLLPAEPDSTFSEFEDEPNDLVFLNGVPFEKQKLVIGPGTGLPEWAAIKMNYIFLLDRITLDGERVTRNTESKFEKTEIAIGYPFNKYSLEIRKAHNEFGLTINDVDVSDNSGRFLSAYTLDAGAFGQAEGTIEIEVEDE